MNLQEATKLVAEARAIYPGMSIVPGIADAWLGILGDLRYPECHAALLLHGRRESRIPVPADLRRLVESARASIPYVAPERLALQSAETQFAGLPIPGRPDWVQQVYEDVKAKQRELNVERKAQGQPPMFGRMFTQPSDHRPGGAA